VIQDWRTQFSDDSRISFDALIERDVGPEAWTAASVFREVWRYDSRAGEARQVEAYFARSRRYLEFDASGIAGLSEKQQRAIDRMVSGTQAVLRSRAIVRLQLYRGQPQTEAAHLGEMVTVTGRALTSWSPDPAIAYSYAARSRPGLVLGTEADVTAVALAYDPTSDGEIVLLGDVAATISKLVT